MSRSKKKIIRMSDRFQKRYRYELTEPTGRNFHPEFKPMLTPKEMLGVGIFGGRYFTDGNTEFPKSWFKGAKLSDHHDDALNYFGVHASKSWEYWKKKGWLNLEHDPRGWVQWYFRYYFGRRLPEEDERQIKRWKAMRRHIGQIKKNCKPRDLDCRPKQRQALLHWAYDSRKM